VATTDLFYDEREPEREWVAAGARAVEMEAATLFRLGERHGVECGAALIVSDLISSRARIAEDVLHEAEHRLGHLAAQAVARPPSQQSQAT
jgi:nucleoside phosphorylase